MFGIPLEGFEDPGIVRYVQGDFFGQHQDVSYAQDADEWARHRRVTAVIWLNDGHVDDTRPYDFEGGTLRLHVNGEHRDFTGRAGDLLLFLSDVLHEVTPVFSGERLVLTTWFLDHI
jgi:predicted 2-oxoglutarate/Fe(II)-dependent dioxygenase YbiX